MSYSQPLVVALDSSLENESEKVAKQLGLHFMGNLKEIQKQYKTNNVNLELIINNIENNITILINSWKNTWNN